MGVGSVCGGWGVKADLAYNTQSWYLQELTVKGAT